MVISLLEKDLELLVVWLMAALPLASIGYGAKLREANLGNGDRKKEREGAEVSCRHNESAKREREREREREILL